jgi:predicted DCC family thiol-disulfide oxidoreductase YuxK
MKTNPQDGKPRHWLIFDGDCGMCRRCAHWVMRHDKRHQFVSAPFQNTPSPPMTPQLKRACEDAVHVVTRDGRILRAGVAVMFILRAILPRPWGFLPRILSGAPWIWPIEAGYKWVAENRPCAARFFFPNGETVNDARPGA